MFKINDRFGIQQRPIIFYQMFELCKKVEVYHIENNYYYLGPRSIDPELKQKLGLHLLRPMPIAALHPDCSKTAKNGKRGLKLSKTINCTGELSSRSHREPTPEYIRVQVRNSSRNVSPHQLAGLKKNGLSRLRTDTDYNANAYPCRFQTPASINKGDYSQKAKQVLHSQKIEAKPKPTFTPIQQQTLTMTSPKFHKEASSQTETKNLSDTKPPISSKIQTSCTNNIFSSQHIVSKYEPQPNNFLRQSFENSSSKLITISKSVSSVHETINERDIRRADGQSDEVSKSGQEISINLSNIFSREDGFGVDNRRQTRETPMKRLSLWQDSDRHTIESRFSREFEFGSQHDIKIEQSIICDHDPRQNFKILQLNQIRKKDYIISLAVQKNINLLASLKEFISNDSKLVVEELQVYELVEKYLIDLPERYREILELYQVQRSQGSHILIKEPYEISMQAKLKFLPEQQSKRYRQKAKQIGLFLIEFLQKYGIYPNRKLTTHQFVICCEEPKIHDLSLFKYIAKPLMTREEAVSGIDI